jgi:hypothetical protein
LHHLVNLPASLLTYFPGCHTWQIDTEGPQTMNLKDFRTSTRMYMATIFAYISFVQVLTQGCWRSGRHGMLVFLGVQAVALFITTLLYCFSWDTSGKVASTLCWCGFSQHSRLVCLFLYHAVVLSPYAKRCRRVVLASLAVIAL